MAGPVLKQRESLHGRLSRTVGARNGRAGTATIWRATRSFTLVASLGIVAAQTLVMAALVAGDVPIPGLYAVSVLAVVAVSWLLGLPAGLIGCVVIVAANTLVLGVIAHDVPVGPFEPIRLFGILGLLLISGAVGQLRNYRDRLYKELSDRRQVEAMLKDAQKELVRQVSERTEELAASNRLLSVESQERRRAEGALWALAEATSSTVGSDFLRSLVKHLASAFRARYAVIVEHLDEPVTRVRTLAFWTGEHLGEDVEYEVAGTPCEAAARGEFVYHAGGVQRLFPNDSMLADLKVESYCAVPLSNSSGRILGHVAILDEKPLAENLCQNPALQIFAARAAAELERRQTEERIAQMQTDLARAYRLVSMGEMASTLAHEIDQPLGVIANDAQACLRGMRSGQLDSDETLAALDEIASEALRTGEIVRRIRQFVSKRAPQRSTVAINELVRQVVGLVDLEIRRRRVALELDLEEFLPKSHVDRIQIQQVLLNLIQNAFDAMDANDTEGRLTLRTRSAEDAVWVSVSDNGKEVPRDQMRRIFEPYYTTKDDGVGMGLSISRSIVHWHDGVLRARARPDGGMTFEFSLPLQGSKS